MWILLLFYLKVKLISVRTGKIAHNKMIILLFKNQRIEHTQG
jgi:hypothetical protein